MNTLRINRNKLVLPLVATGLAASALTACSDPEVYAKSSTRKNVGCAISFDDYELAEYGENGSKDLVDDLAAAVDMTTEEVENELMRENQGADPETLPHDGKRFVVVGQAVCNVLKRNPEDGFYVTQLFESN